MKDRKLEIDSLEEDDMFYADLFLKVRKYKIMYKFIDRYIVVELTDRGFKRQRTVSRRWLDDHFLTKASYDDEFKVTWVEVIKYVIVLFFILQIVTMLLWMIVEITISTG